jgi:hypothetical protein
VSSASTLACLAQDRVCGLQSMVVRLAMIKSPLFMGVKTNIGNHNRFFNGLQHVFFSNGCNVIVLKASGTPLF